MRAGRYFISPTHGAVNTFITPLNFCSALCALQSTCNLQLLHVVADGGSVSEPRCDQPGEALCSQAGRRKRSPRPPRATVLQAPKTPL